MSSKQSSVSSEQNPKYLMWAGCYSGNSLIFWRKGKAGYISNIKKAHQFEFEEALKIQEGSDGEHKMIPLSHCKEIATKQIHADHLDRNLVGKRLCGAASLREQGKESPNV